MHHTLDQQSQETQQCKRTHTKTAIWNIWFRDNTSIWVTDNISDPHGCSILSFALKFPSKSISLVVVGSASHPRPTMSRSTAMQRQPHGKQWWNQILPWHQQTCELQIRNISDQDKCSIVSCTSAAISLVVILSSSRLNPTLSYNRWGNDRWPHN